MTQKQIVERLNRLEQQVADLQRQSSGGWHETAGTFANDPLFDRAMRYGAEYRRSTRPKSRSRKAKRS